MIASDRYSVLTLCRTHVLSLSLAFVRCPCSPLTLRHLNLFFLYYRGYKKKIIIIIIIPPTAELLLARTRLTHAGEVVCVEWIANRTPRVAFAGALHVTLRLTVRITCYSITSIVITIAQHIDQNNNRSLSLFTALTWLVL